MSIFYIILYLNMYTYKKILEYEMYKFVTKYIRYQIIFYNLLII